MSSLAWSACIFLKSQYVSKLDAGEFRFIDYTNNEVQIVCEFKFSSMNDI